MGPSLRYQVTPQNRSRPEPTQPVPQNPPPSPDQTGQVALPHDPVDRNTPTSIAVERAISRRFSEWPKYISLLLTVIALVVGMAIWATNSHAEIKDWTAEQDFVTKTELRSVMKEQYVPLHEFTKVKQSLDDTKAQLEKMDDKLDKVLNRLHN